MQDQDQENTNCIIKVFETHSIFIFEDNFTNTKQYYFKANDVAKILDITCIYAVIQNYDEDEVVSRMALDQRGSMQDTKFLTSAGIYKLLFFSKHALAKQFKKWSSTILTDIIQNNSEELKKKLLQYQEKIQQLEYKHKIELENNEIEKNWLHNITRNKVTLKKYVTKTDGIYLGAAAFEHQNYIEKIGKSIDVSKRKDKLATSGSGVNTFQVYKNYETYAGLEHPTEKYVHSLLSPFHINSERSGTEYFMIHRGIANTVIEKVIADQNSTVELINNYIDLLQINQYNYRVTDIAMQGTIVVRNLIKTCANCNKNLNSNMFLQNNEKCNICISNQTQIVDNTLTGKKKCSRCEETYNLDMFFIDKDNRNLLIAECRNCINVQENCSVKQCNMCFVIQTYNNFRKTTSKDNHAAQCNMCYDIQKLRWCVHFIPDNLINCQRTAVCIEAQQTLTDTVPLKTLDKTLPIEPGIKKTLTLTL